MTFSLVFGDLDFSPDAQSGPVTVEVYGLKRGRPVPVVSVVQTLLQDGTSERVDREDNRDVTILLGIEGQDSKALADFEALLRTEVARERNELTYAPPDGFGFPSVFDVLWADLQPFDDDGWDLDEVMRGRRLYTLALRCLPFARSVDEVEVVATPTSATPTTVDDATSTTNWTNWNGPGGSVDADVAVSAVTFEGRSAVKYRNNESGTLGSFAVKYTGTAPSQAYTGIVVYATVDGVAISAGGTGAFTMPLAIDTDGPWHTYWFETPSPDAPLYFSIGNGSSGWSPGAEMWVDKIVTSPGIGFAALVAVEVFGSVRTTGRYTLSRADGTGGLGWVTVFSDPAMANGAYHPAVEATWHNAPEGTYAFWMDPRGGVVEVTVTDAIGQSQTMTTQGPWTNPVTGESHPDMMPVGELTLGGTYDGLVGALTFEVKVDGIIVTGPDTPRLFRKHPDSSLTHVLVDGDLAAVATEVIIESPSVDRPFGGVWCDGVSAIGKCVAWEDPTFAPQWTYLFVEADNSDADPVETVAAYYPRHHTHATR